jgi:hypothetical protein
MSASCPASRSSARATCGAGLRIGEATKGQSALRLRPPSPSRRRTWRRHLLLPTLGPERTKRSVGWSPLACRSLRPSASRARLLRGPKPCS